MGRDIPPRRFAKPVHSFGQKFVKADASESGNTLALCRERKRSVLRGDVPAEKCVRGRGIRFGRCSVPARR